MNKFSLFLLVFSSLIHSNEISFNEVKESDDGSIEISFLLDKVSFIKSYSLIDPSRIVIDIYNSDLKSDVFFRSCFKAVATGVGPRLNFPTSVAGQYVVFPREEWKTGCS